MVSKSVLLMIIPASPRAISVQNGRPVGVISCSKTYIIVHAAFAVRTDFQVTDKMPNITFDLGRNWAGSIPVGISDRPNNTLFFWAFEKENGSLTAAAGERNDEPWGIWLNGGCVVFHFGNINDMLIRHNSRDAGQDRRVCWEWRSR